jgi:hypothetical protein
MKKNGAVVLKKSFLVKIFFVGVTGIGSTIA